MNRQEFIVALRKELKKLPPEEIVAATEYFEEYIDEVMESGEKTEEEIIDEFGSPKRVAAQIKADYAARILDGDESVEDSGKATKKISAVWWVILGICSAPVSIPLAVSIGGAIISAIVGILGIVIGIYGTIIGLGAMAIFLVSMGIIALGSSVSSALIFLGVGLLLAAITAAAAVGAFIGTKALIRVLVKAVRNTQEKRKLKKGESHNE